MKPALLDLELGLRRAPVLVTLAGLLLLGAVAAHWFVLRPLAAEGAEARTRLQTVASPAAVAAAAEPAPRALSVVETRLAAFESTLCDTDKINTLIGTVFEQALRHELVLAQAEYKLEHDKAGGFGSYQVTLPVRGPYPKLRAFADAALGEVRCAAIDDIDFKREGIAVAQVEARIRLVFFLRGPAS